MKKNRQTIYANQVKTNHPPTIDKTKQSESISRTNDLRISKNTVELSIQKQQQSEAIKISTSNHTTTTHYHPSSSSKKGMDQFEFAKKYNREHKKIQSEKEFDINHESSNNLQKRSL